MAKKTEPTPAVSEPITIDGSTADAIRTRADAAGKDVPQFLADHFATAHRQVSSIEDLIAMASAPKERSFMLNGVPLKITIRALTAEEAAETDRLLDQVVAPIGKDGKPDRENAAYRAAMEDAVRLKRAAMWDLAVVGLKPPGANLKEKADYLYKHLPPGVIVEVGSAILQLTSDPIEHAVFS